MPYASEAQRRFFNSPTGKKKIGKEVVEEFNEESKGKEIPERVTDEGLRELNISDEEKHRRYVEILKIAKAAENQAIKIPMIAMAFAPEEDIAQLAEVQNDENDHDAIYTDLLFKAVTGNPDGADNTIYYATDADSFGAFEELDIDRITWKDVKRLNRAITEAMANGNDELAAHYNKLLNNFYDEFVRGAMSEILERGGYD